MQFYYDFIRCFEYLIRTLLLFDIGVGGSLLHIFVFGTCISLVSTSVIRNIVAGIDSASRNIARRNRGKK